MKTAQLPRIYLAGPDVFFPDAGARFAHLAALCFARGMVGEAPSDAGVSALLSEGIAPQEVARRIYVENVQHIRNCDAVLANMTPFRGALEPDSGTAFEVGMAIALGKPVALYLPQGLEDTGPRIRRICGHTADGADGRYGALIEDFGLPLNLMLACACAFFTTPTDGLDHLQQILL